MALVTIASSTTTASVIEGMIMSPLAGRWYADLRIDQSGTSLFPGGTQVTITSESGYSRTGVVDPNRTGSRLDAVHLRVLGGAGGVLNNASARAFVQPGAFVRDVVNGLMADSGETLDSTSSQSFLATNLTAWSTIGGNSVSRNLRILLQLVAPTLGWRILANGNLWIGAETWPTSSTAFDTIDFDPKEQSYHIGSEAPFIVPGVNLSGVGNVSRVLDTIAEGQMRTRVWIDIPGLKRGQADAMQQVALNAVPGVDYYASYVCSVQAQSSDLTTVDVLPQGARNQALLGGLQRVPLRVIGGFKVQLAPSSTVLLSWDGGDPRSPYAHGGFVGDTALALQLAGTDAVVTQTDIANIKLAITGAAVVPQDGGAAFKANILAAWPPSVGSTKVGAGR